MDQKEFFSVLFLVLFVCLGVVLKVLRSSTTKTKGGGLDNHVTIDSC